MEDTTSNAAKKDLSRMPMKTLPQRTTKKYMFALLPFFPSPSETIKLMASHGRVEESLNVRRLCFSHVLDLAPKNLIP